jgi:hypothetical protein
MPADDALETAAFGLADDVDEFAFFKDVDRKDVAEFLLVANLKAGEFPQDALRLTAGLGEMAFQSLGQMLFLPVVKCQLDGIVTVRFLGPDLGHHTWARFNDRAGHILPALVKDAGHPYFLSD